MSVTISNRNFSTRRHPTGNSFLLTNTGNLIKESFNISFDFDFLSDSTDFAKFINPNEIQLLSGVWFEKGFNIGDNINISFNYNLNAGAGGGGSPTSVTLLTEITDIIGNLLILDDNLSTTDFNAINSILMPTSSGSTEVSQLSIENSTVEAPQRLEIYHNLIENGQNQTNFSLLDGEVNRLIFDGLPTLLVNDSVDFVQYGDKSGGTYFDCVLTRLADVNSKRIYRVDLNYDQYLKLEDSNLLEPVWFEQSNSLKTSYEFNVIPQINNPNSRLNFKYSNLLGNVGWYDENYNQGINEFTIDSILIEDDLGNALPQIDYSQRNTIQFTITSTQNFSDEVELEFYIIPPIDEITNNPRSLADNLRLSNSYIGNTIENKVFGFNNQKFTIIDQVITTSTNQIIVDFKITPSTEVIQYLDTLSEVERLFSLGINVESESNSANNNNSVTLRYAGNFIKAEPEPSELDRVDFQAFYNHANGLNGDSIINYEGCTEDDFVYKSLFRLDNNAVWQSLNLAVQIVRDSNGESFDLFSQNINLQNFVINNDGQIQINYLENLSQNLPNPDRNKIQLSLTGIEGASDYQVELIWSMLANWRYWIAQSNAFTDFFDSSLPNNGLTAEWMRYLRVNGYTLKVKCNLVNDLDVKFFENLIDLQDYEDSNDFTTTIKIFNENNVELNAITSGADVRIEVLHESTSSLDTNNLWGWIAFRPKESDPRNLISTVWDWSNNNLPLKPLSGETKVKVTYPTATSVKFEALIDTSNLSDNVTIVSRVENEGIRNVYKKEFKTVSIPTFRDEEDEFSSNTCKEPFVVLADLNNANYERNDRTGIALKCDVLTVELEKDGVLINAPGISVDFPYQDDAKGFVIDWRQVVSGGDLAVGCYKVKVSYDISGITGSYYFGTYDLRKYNLVNVKDTVQMFVVLNDYVRKDGINYRDSGFSTTIRFNGKFGYMQPNYNSENIIYNDRLREKVRNEAVRKYELKTNRLLNCYTQRLDAEFLLCANQIFITDNNPTNHEIYNKFAVIVDEEQTPTFEYTDEGVYAKMTAFFKEKVQVSESKYNGEIKGSENVILQLPTVIGSGISCDNADLTLNGIDFLSVASGSDTNIELVDQDDNSIIPLSVVGSTITVNLVTPEFLDIIAEMFKGRVEFDGGTFVEKQCLINEVNNLL